MVGEEEMVWGGGVQEEEICVKTSVCGIDRDGMKAGRRFKAGK